MERKELRGNIHPGWHLAPKEIKGKHFSNPLNRNVDASCLAFNSVNILF